MNDIYDLHRFIQAQENVYTSVLNELKIGQKSGHWMWYIFPQIDGLGVSATAQKYAISSKEEARAYSNHPILGLRLRECTQLVLNVEGRSAEKIFGYPDVLKFRSCMTLFEQSAVNQSIFHDAILKYFDGKLDQLTLDFLKG
jgi:uncharacterized protein (DUF1810 family)